MTKIIILLSLVMATMLWANTPEKNHMDRQRAGHIKKMQHPQKHRRNHSMEKKHKHKKTARRTFRTAQEFRHTKRKHRKQHKIKNHMKHSKSMLRGEAYSRDRYAYSYYDDRRYENRRSRGFRHYKHRWYTAYRYERASFYDNEGFYYGYFNRRGYTFEGEFYRYDRYYSYQDRLRGKGLFVHRYFRPVVEYYSHNEYNDDYDSY
jgi:hypothetical protein